MLSSLIKIFDLDCLFLKNSKYYIAKSIWNLKLKLRFYFSFIDEAQRISLLRTKKNQTFFIIVIIFGTTKTLWLILKKLLEGNSEVDISNFS